MDHSEKRPDFLAHPEHGRFYLEARAVHPTSSPATEDALEKDVVAKINTLRSSNFRIFAQVKGKLPRALSRDQVTRPFRELLETHDPDAVQRRRDESGWRAAPSRKITCGDWSLQGWLRPIPQERRGDGNPRNMIIGPARAGGVGTPTQVRRAIVDKAGRYGRLDAPLVVACNVLDPFFNCVNDELDALFGREQVEFVEEHPEFPVELTREPNGIWVGPGYKPRYTRLNAVMLFRNMTPWHLFAPVCLYLNPFVEESGLPAGLYRLPHAEVKDGKMHWVG